MNARLILILAATLTPFVQGQTPDPCATNPQSCATLINTNATARTRLPNTAVDVSLTITYNDKDLPTVQRIIGTRSAQLLNYLRGQQVQRLITSSVSFHPETKYKDGSLNKTVGYDGTLRISFRTTPDKAPDVLSGALANGANSIERTTFTPTEDEIAAARRQLSAEATRSAIAQADSIAAAAGLHVASIRQIGIGSEPAPGISGYAYSALNGLADDKADRLIPDTQTEAGEDALSVTVTLTAAATH